MSQRVVHEFCDTTELVHGLYKRIIRGAIIESLLFVRAVLKILYIHIHSELRGINVPEEDMPWPSCYQ